MTMKSYQTQAKENGSLLFLPSLFYETMDIIFDSYEYFQFQENSEQDHVPPFLHAMYSHEMSRITMRLTSVMAWLMARKAISSGQLGGEDDPNSYRLDAIDECMMRNEAMEEYMPDYMKFLLDESFKLYERVYRLDRQLDS